MVETKNYRLLNKGVRLLQAIAVVAMVSLPLMAVAQEAQPAASGEVAIPLAGEVATPPAGDYATGNALFTGEKRFTNGGPPCISCHSAGVGALGGGILGPNLTQVYSGPKRALLMTGWVNSPGLPVM